MPDGAVLDGVLERVTFANPETGYTIARIAPERGSGVGAELVTAVGPLLGAQVGEFLRLRGRWSSHPRYGKQFEVHSYTTVAIRPEVAKYRDVVASVVNLKYARGAIGNVESYVQAKYAYDVRTEIVGSTGSIFVGSLQQMPATFLSTQGSNQILADHFLTRFSDAYVAEVRDFVRTMLTDDAPRVTGEDGLKALEIAVAAENSHLNSRPYRVSS